MSSDPESASLTLDIAGDESELVQRAWSRARAMGVDASGIGHVESVDVGSRLAVRQLSMQHLVRSGQSVLDDLAQDLAHRHFALLPVDFKKVAA